MIKKIKCALALLMAAVLVFALVSCSEEGKITEPAEATQTSDIDINKINDEKASKKFGFYERDGKYFVKVDDYEYYINRDSYNQYGYAISVYFPSVEDMAKAMENGEIEYQPDLQTICRWGSQETGIETFNPYKLYKPSRIKELLIGGEIISSVSWERSTYTMQYVLETGKAVAHTYANAVSFHMTNEDIFKRYIDSEVTEKEEKEKEGFEYLCYSPEDLRTVKVRTIYDGEEAGEHHIVYYVEIINYNKDLDIYYYIMGYFIDTPVTEELISGIETFEKVDFKPCGLESEAID